MAGPDPERTAAAHDRAIAALLAARNDRGHWEGRLSSSALSTATALMALHRRNESGDDHALIQGGLRWLAGTQCPDGGWGDTPGSRPNLSTTLLCWSAFGMAAADDFTWRDVIRRCESWIRQAAGGLEPAVLSAALERRYGRDRTFSVPILMTCAIAGRLGPAPECWQYVPQLPFELAALPRSWFAALRLPVVSYALPALIAIGQVRFASAPGRGPLAVLRRSVVPRTRRLLRQIQPEGGGFLEAVPLTSFVCLAMTASGDGSSDVVRKCAAFLRNSARPDGSWAIDSNLATWTTTLSVKALGNAIPPADAARIHNWLTAQQTRVIHPYTRSAPGGWAWTDLPGGVPDADDTSGALLALKLTGGTAREAARAGIRWLSGLQNRDGGIPTFCRGWGTLPFDRSTPDITAHALAAMNAWRDSAGPDLLRTMHRAIRWLHRTQRPDGSWVPLWFGNEHAPDEENPVYGTAIVLKYLSALPQDTFPALRGILPKAAGYLLHSQHATGGWSGAPGTDILSIEETAVAIEALAAFEAVAPSPDSRTGASIDRGTSALLDLTNDGRQFPPSPIGLYFARLWYHEDLYPLIFTAGALRAVRRRTVPAAPTSGH